MTLVWQLSGALATIWLWSVGGHGACPATGTAKTIMCRMQRTKPKASQMIDEVSHQLNESAHFIMLVSQELEQKR